MGPFLLIATDPEANTPEPSTISAAVRLESSGCTPYRLTAHVELLLSDRHPLALMTRADGRAVLLGDVFGAHPARRPQDCLDRTMGLTDLDVARAMLEGVWGRYILLLLSGEGALHGVFRDPGGGLECRHWRHRGRFIAASDAGAVLDGLRPERLAIDWTLLAALLADPAGLSLGSGLIGVQAIAPGAYHDVARAIDQQVWRPVDRACRPILDADRAGETLMRAVDTAVGRLAGGRPVAAEVSGGLDSSIVASALQATRADCVGWFHRAPSEASANEEVYAEALARHLGVALRVSPLPDLVFDLDDIALNQADVTPSVSSLDLSAEVAAIGLCERAGAQALFTGMGGDAVFWSAPTVLALSDRLARTGWRGAADAEALALARWTRLPLWKALVAAAQANRRPLPPIYTRPPWAVVDGPAPHHPWLDGVDALPAGKRLQIAALALMQSATGASQRRRALDLVHPLLAQPVLEACLAIPLDILTLGGRDRGLARHAFARRLPPLVRHRRSKGDISERIAKSLADGLDRLRDLLLGGRLVERGLIDADRLATTLTLDTLAQGADLLALYRAAAIELWIRQWEGRLRLA